MFSERNKKRDFDALQKNKLGIYVYALIDPKDKYVIYVGKGGGDIDGPGNKRIFDHFEDAEKKLGESSNKLESIRSVWSSGRDVDWVIVRHGLPSAEEAHKIEQSLIDLLNISKNGETTNAVLGHGAKEFGLLDEMGVSKLAARCVLPSKPISVLVFTIRKSIRGKGGLNATKQEVYEATRKSWSIDVNKLKQFGCVYAVGVDDGYSLGAYKIKEWETYENGKRGFLKDGDDKVCDELLHRDWKDVLEPIKNWRRRSAGVALLEFDGDGRYRNLRGTKDNNWYALKQNP